MRVIHQVPDTTRYVGMQRGRAETALADIHFSQPLTDFTVAAFQKKENFVANRTPFVAVDKTTGKFYVYNDGDLNSPQMEKRQSLSTAATGGFKRSLKSYETELRSLAYKVDRRVALQFDKPMSFDKDAEKFLSTQAAIERELDFVNKIWNSTPWTTKLTGVATSGEVDTTHILRWKKAGSSPIKDIRNWRETIQILTGERANVMYIGKDVWDVLIDHEEIQARVQSNGNGDGARKPMTRRAVCELLELDEIEVSEAVINMAQEGAAKDMRRILKNGLLLAHMEMEQLDEMSMTAFSRFAYKGESGNGVDGILMKYREDPDINALVYEVDSDYSFEIVAPDAGLFVDKILTD